MKNLTIDQICEAALDLALEKFGSLEIFYDDSGSKKIGSELKNNKEKTIKATQDGFDVKFGAVALETNVEDFKREYLESEITNLISNIKKDIKTSPLITANLPIMDGESRCTVKVKNGLSLRAWKASNIKNDSILLRIDILYG